MATEQLQAVFNAVETVSNALDDINRSIQEQQNELAELNADYIANSGATEAAEQSQAALAREINDVSRAFGETQRAMAGYNAISGAVTAANAQMSTALQVLQGRMDEMGDETAQATRRLTTYQAVSQSAAFSMGSLSVNVGAFTIALRDLGTQIPVLVTTLGSLLSVVGGLATAFATLSAGIGAMGLAGAIGMAQQLEEQFAGIEDGAQAMQAMMEGLRDLFIDAFEPLMNEQNIAFFTQMVEWLARLVNRFAQFVNQIRPMLMDFLNTVSEGTDDVDELFNALAQGFEIAGPALADLIIWLNNRLPDAILFMSQTVAELSEPLGRLVDTFLNMTSSLVDLAGGVFPALVSVLDMLLGAIRIIADAANFLGDGIVELAATFLLATFAATKVMSTLNALAGPLLTLSSNFAAVNQGATGLIPKLRSLQTLVSQNATQAFPALSVALFGTSKSAKELQQSLGVSSQMAQTLAGRTGILTGSMKSLRTSMLSLLPVVKSTNGAFAVSGVQGFVSPQDLTIMQALKLQLVQIRTAAFSAAGSVRTFAVSLATTMYNAALRAASGLATVAIGLGQVLVGAAGAAQTALIGALHPGLVRSTALTQMWNASLAQLQAGLTKLVPAQIRAAVANINFAGAAGTARAATMAFLGGIWNLIVGLGQSLVGAAGAAQTALVGALHPGLIRSTALTQMWNASMTQLRAGLVRMIPTTLQQAFANQTYTASLRSAIGATWQWLVAQKQAIAASIRDAGAKAVQAVATHGVVGATRLAVGSLWGMVTALGATALGALSTAAAFVGGLIPASISAGIALNAALGGIPLILAAIVGLGAVVVGMLGNMDAAVSGAGSAWNSFKSIIESVGNSLLKVFVPAWNILVGIFEILLAPIFAIIDGLGMIFGAFSGAEGEGGGFIQTLLKGFDQLMGAIGGFLSMFDTAFNIIGDLVYAAFIIPFQILAHVIGIVVDVIRDLWEGFMNLKIVQDVISSIMDWFDALGNLIDDIISGAISIINGLIDTANLIPGVSIEKVGVDQGGEGLRTTAGEVRENMARDEEDADSDVETEPDLNLSFEDSVEQNIDVQADPEDREQMRRTVKDAMNEANALQRRREGHGG